MADYYPLIAKAVAGLEKSTGEARRALYDRARSALVAQLRGVTPALSESDITRERLSLEEAIRKVETEAARRSRTDPPPRATPPPPARPARPDMPPPPSVDAVEMRPAPPQIRVSPSAAPMASEPVHAQEGNGGTGNGGTGDQGLGDQGLGDRGLSNQGLGNGVIGNADIGVEPVREAPAPPPERPPRWTPSGGGPSISDRGLKGFRDVVADGETLAGTAAAAAKNIRAGGAGAALEPPPASAFERAEPRLEAEPIRPPVRRPTPRDAERGSARPPAPEPGRAREVREPRRPRDPEPLRPSSRRLEPPPPPPFLDTPAGQPGPAAPVPPIDDFELTRPPSSMVRQEDLRRPSAPRAPQPEKRREKRADKRPEKRPEPRPETRDDKRVDRWAERPPEQKKSRFAALPLRKIAIGSVLALIALATVGFLIWKPPTTIIGWFRGGPNLPRPAETRDAGARPKIADRIGGPATSPGAEEGTLVAQKVVLYEEDPNNPNGNQYVGSVVWRTESVPPAPGQPPDIAVRGDIEIPEQKISARWSLRRNDDKALPASHTVEVMFTLPADFVHGGITNVPGVYLKPSESMRGAPLAGLAVKVTNNFFLIGLSSVEAERARNIQLLKERSWFDIPVLFNDGRRGIMAIEKGTPGERAFARAFEAWGQ
jgi:hypothetical protein